MSGRVGCRGGWDVREGGTSGRVGCQGGWDVREGGGWACDGCMTPTVCPQTEESTVMDVIERATPTIIKRYLATLTLKERVGIYHLYVVTACVALLFSSLSSLSSLPSLPYNRQSSALPVTVSIWPGWQIVLPVSWSKEVTETASEMHGPSASLDCWSLTCCLTPAPPLCALHGHTPSTGW